VERIIFPDFKNNESAKGKIQPIKNKKHFNKFQLTSVQKFGEQTTIYCMYPNIKKFVTDLSLIYSSHETCRSTFNMSDLLICH